MSKQVPHQSVPKLTKSMATTTLGGKAISKDTKKAAAAVAGGHGGQHVISKKAAVGGGHGGQQAISKKAAVGGGHGGQQVISKKTTAGSAAAGSAAAGSAAAGSAAGRENQLLDKDKFRAILARGIKSGAIKPVQIGVPLYNYDPRTKKSVWGGKRKR